MKEHIENLEKHQIQIKMREIENILKDIHYYDAMGLLECTKSHMFYNHFIEGDVNNETKFN